MKKVKLSKIKAAGSYQEFRDGLEEAGAKYLGSGAFATALELNGFAVKVGYMEGNEGYMTWLKHALALQGNPHVPRIYSAAVFEHTDSSYFMVVMEILQDSKVSRSFDDGGQAFRDWYKDVKGAARHLSAEIRDMKKAGMLKKQIRSIIKERDVCPIAAAIALAERLGHIENCIDMHEGNVMLRGNVPVITDPIC
jgi:hypothetical protein